MTTPSQFLAQAIRAVPAVKYALGIGGVVAAVAIVYSFKIDSRVAFVGTLVMLVLMGVLVIFARMSSLPGHRLNLPALVFTWFVLLLFMALSGSLFASVFFQKPLDLSSWLTGNAANPRDAIELPRRASAPISKIIDPTTGQELGFPSMKANPFLAVAENDMYTAILKNDGRLIEEAARKLRIVRVSEGSREAAEKAAKAAKD